MLENNQKDAIHNPAAKRATAKTVLGWREWVSLPELDIARIKVKVDTGARTCALHAYFVEPYQRDGKLWVRFGIHPQQRTVEQAVECHAAVVDRREVTDSGGHRELRYVIRTAIVIGATAIDAEVTLTDRENMHFRMLLGRNAIIGNFTVDPELSYLQSG